jgi:hypothetical protein
MSNVGRHGSSRLSSKRRCISRCSRFAPVPAFARAVRPLAVGEPQQRFHQVHVAARSGCPSFGGQRTAGSMQAPRSPANARFAEASQNQACASARRWSHSSRSRRAARSAQTGHLRAVARLLSDARQCQAEFSARCRLHAGQSTVHAVQLAAAHGLLAKAKVAHGCRRAVLLCVPPNPSIERTCPGKPGHAAHVER